MVEYLRIGKIVNTMGIKGEVKILPLTDNPDRFNKLKWCFVENRGEQKEINIEAIRFHKNFVIAKFQGIDDMNTAQRLKEAYVLVDRQNAVKLKKDEYFICDLIGLEVYTIENEFIGTIKDVITTGSNDVYVIQTEEGKEILIPAIKQVVKEVSIENKKMLVEMMEGLMEWGFRY